MDRFVQKEFYGWVNLGFVICVKATKLSQAESGMRMLGNDNMAQYTELHECYLFERLCRNKTCAVFFEAKRTNTNITHIKEFVPN